MPGKKVRSELKSMIIEESLQPACVVAGLARWYGGTEFAKIPYMAGAVGVISQHYP